MTVDWIWALVLGVLALLVLIQGFVLVEVLRQIGILRLRYGDDPGALITEGLPRGTIAPLVEDSILGEVSGLPGVRRLLVFLSPRCESCRIVAGFLHDLSRELKDAKIAAICIGQDSECQQLARDTNLRLPLIVDRDLRISKSYDASRTPSATLVDADDRVRLHGIVNTVDQLRGLLNEEGTLKQFPQWSPTLSPTQAPANELSANPKEGG